MAKRNYPEVACADCGRQAKQATKTTKFCSTCRLGRGCAWHDGREATCSCGAKYVAWNGVKSNPRCGRCLITAAPAGGREAVEGDCAYCHEHGIVYSDRISICYPCLYDPRHADSVKASVARKYRRLLERKEGAA